MNVGSLEFDFLANIARLQKDMQEATRVVGKASSDMQSLLNKVNGALQFAGASIGIATLTALAKSVVDSADEINKMSQKTGIAAEELSTLSYAAKLSDVDNQKLTKGIKLLGEQMTKANDPLSDAAYIMKGLGINIKGGTLQALETLADQMAALPDGATKIELATRVLGKAGQDMIPFLNQGAEGIRKMREEAKALGLQISTETAQNAEKFNDNLRALSMSSTALFRTLFNELSPQLVQFTDNLKQAYIDSGALNALWVGMGGVGTAIFTDDMLSRPQQIEKEMKALTSQIESLKESLGASGGLLGIIFNDKWNVQITQQIVDATEKLRLLKKEKEAGAVADKAAAEAAKQKAAADAKAKSEAEKRTAQLLSQKAATDAANQEYEREIASLNKLMVERKQELELGRKLTESEKLLADYAAKRFEKMTPMQKELVKQKVLQVAAVMKEIEAEQQTIAIFEHKVKLLRELQEQDVDAINARNETIANLRESNGLLAAEVEALLGNKTAVDEYTDALAREKAIKTALTDEDEERIKKLFDEQAALRARKRDIEDQRESFKSWFDVVDNGFKAALNGAKSFGDYLKTSLKNVLYELVARPFIINIAAALSGTNASAMGNMLGGSGSGFGNIVSGLGNLFGLGGSASALAGTGGTLMNGLSAIGLTGTSQFVGGLTGAISGPGLTGAAGMGSNAAGMLSTAGPYIAAALAAYQLYQTFRDKGENPKYRLGFGSAAQGYASDSLFGAQGFQYAQGNDAQNQGFRDAQRGTAGIDALIARNMSAAQIAAATSRLNGVTGREFSFPKGDPTASEQLLLEFTKLKYAAVFKDLDKTFSDYIANFTGKSDDLIKAIGEMAGVMDVLASSSIKGLTLDALRAFQQGTESLGQTLQRVTQAYASYEQLFVPQQERDKKMFDALRNEIAAAGGALPNTRDGFRRLVESLDLTDEKQRALWQTLVNNAAVADAYYRSLESVAGATTTVTAATRDFAAEADVAATAIGDALDAIQQLQSFRAGNNEIIANTLMNRPGYSYSGYLAGNVTSARASLLTSLNGSGTVADRLAAAGGLRDALGAQFNYQMQQLQQQQQAQIEARRAEISAIRETANNARQLADTFRAIGAFGRGLLTSDVSPLSPNAKLAEVARQYGATLSAARGGDRNAAGALSGVAQNYISMARDYYGSGQGFTDIFNTVQRDTDAFNAMADQQLSIAESQLASAQAQEAALNSLATELTPEMIELQDEYVRELRLLNTMSEAWEQEQRNIATTNAAVYRQIAASNSEVADNTRNLRADIQQLIGTIVAGNQIQVAMLNGQFKGNASAQRAADALDSVASTTVLGEARKLVNA